MKVDFSLFTSRYQNHEQRWRSGCGVRCGMTVEVEIRLRRALKSCWMYLGMRRRSMLWMTPSGRMISSDLMTQAAPAVLPPLLCLREIFSASQQSGVVGGGLVGPMSGFNAGGYDVEEEDAIDLRIHGRTNVGLKLGITGNAKMLAAREIKRRTP